MSDSNSDGKTDKTESDTNFTRDPLLLSVLKEIAPTVVCYAALGGIIFFCNVLQVKHPNFCNGATSFLKVVCPIIFGLALIGSCGSSYGHSIGCSR